MSYQYSQIQRLGSQVDQSPQANPLSYCAVSGLESGFHHTIGGGAGLVGPDSFQCQRFMAGYCSIPKDGKDGWDQVCEYMSKDTQVGAYPNGMGPYQSPTQCLLGTGINNPMTKGQILIRNTASEKYLVLMSSNCIRQYEAFDATVSGSPLISRWVPDGSSSGGVCVPVYDVDASTIDNDPVMNKILGMPWIAMDILINIYNYRMSTGTISELQGTKLGQLFDSPDFQTIASSGLYRM